MVSLPSRFRQIGVGGGIKFPALGLSPLGPYHALLYGPSFYFDVRRVRQDLGWRAKWSDAEMICESNDWYRAHRDAVWGRDGLHRTSPVEQGILALAKRFF
jgi:hypothetical protein